MVEYIDTNAEILTQVTLFLRYLNKSFNDKIVYAIENPHPMDRSIVFHLVSKDEKDDLRTFVLSAEFIADHPFWEK